MSPVSVRAHESFGEAAYERPVRAPRVRGRFPGGGALAAGLLLWAALAALTREVILYNRNTLHRNGSWVSSKLLMQMGLMGAGHFVATRNALHGNQLNLAEWYGYNEVHLARPVPPSEMDVRFRLDPAAYLDVILDRRESGRQGIRLSRAERFPSERYRADRSGRIVERTPVAVPRARLEGGWHDLRCLFRGGSVETSLDGEPLALVPVEPGDERDGRFVGFGGGYGQAAIARVRILGPDGAVVLDETFRNRRDALLAGAAVSCLALLGVLLVSVPIWRTAAAPRIATYRALMLLAAVSVGLATLHAFDYLVWSNRYFYAQLSEGQRSLLTTSSGLERLPLAIHLEGLRGSFFRTGEVNGLYRPWFSRTPAALWRSLSAWDSRWVDMVDRYACYRGLTPVPASFLRDGDARRMPAEAEGGLRVAVLGSSQTYGIGAETVAETFVARAHARLATELGPAALTTCNFSIPGAKSEMLRRRYHESWRFVRPDLVVVNLANNDGQQSVLVENLRSIAEEARGSGGKVVFVLEANSTEKDTAWLLRRHAAIRGLGAALGVPVWDLHGYLASSGVYDSGRLWWDAVHMTNHAQGLTADWLAARMLPVLRGEVPR